MHLVFFLGMSGLLEVQLATPDAARVNPLQTRMLTPVVPVAPAVKAPKPAAPRTRIAKEAAPPPAAPLPQTPIAQAPTPEASAPEKEASSAVATADAPKSPASEATTASTTAPVPEAPPAVTAATEPAPTEVLPNIPLGALPPSMLLSYNLTGMEKGITYHASGELNWQHNDQAYTLALSVKAFLLGSRHWRSQGQITAAGLAPSKFTDSWRGERASHFDRENKQVVFSSNAPTAQLLPGAQDQISLYVQLASAMAGSPERFTPGTRLSIQTVTLREAVPWILTLEQAETLTLNSEILETTKWSAQPRNRFDAKVEFWVSPKHGWLPVRIRITQVSGSYIDLLMNGQKILPALPATTPAG
ncbi:hypothetical protein B9Z51_11325 [Limnohabitans sp. T6-5]|nr:hypothetical protein B9Z51_11325 [Limnohabitans sp. T6-5]